MKGLVIDVKRKKVKIVEDNTPLPSLPSRPKVYRIYKELRTIKGRIIKIPFSEPIELTEEEIEDLKKQGYMVEEIEW